MYENFFTHKQKEETQIEKKKKHNRVWMQCAGSVRTDIVVALRFGHRISPRSGCIALQVTAQPLERKTFPRRMIPITEAKLLLWVIPEQSVSLRVLCPVGGDDPSTAGTWGTRVKIAGVTALQDFITVLLSRFPNARLS